MRKYLLAAVAAAAIAAPASAQVGPYVGVEGGFLFPADLDGDVAIDFTSGGLPDMTSSDAFQVDFNRGRDLDVIAGYDFGMFRVEGEFGWKRAGLDNVEFADAVADDFEDAGFDEEDFDLDGRMKIRSLMVNGLADFPVSERMNAFVGAGVGRARARLGGERDKSTAWQLLAGVRAAVSDSVDLGLKYRYFRTGRLGFAASEAFSGDIDGDGDIDAGIATVSSGGRFKSHSLLASLIFNLGSRAAPAVVDVAPPPPPPPAPATQTCPDGSVILATDICPAPPPPPPPGPAPAGERG